MIIRVDNCVHVLPKIYYYDYQDRVPRKQQNNQKQEETSDVYRIRKTFQLCF